MKIFALYNYMFEKITNDDIFNDEEQKQVIEQNFTRRQECLDDVLVDDHNKERCIHFTNTRGTEYLHHFLLNPVKEEGIYVLRILKNCRGIRHDENFKSIPFDDYRSCIIIIDNRPGIQLIAIENATSAFHSLETVERIIERTLSRVMAQRFSLRMSIKNIYDAARFWNIAQDKKSYPRGFRKVEFTWPKPNLERLAKRFEFIQGIRKDTESAVTLVTDAGAGKSVKLNPDDQWTRDVVEVASNIGGEASIRLTPNGSRRKINVGKNCYKFITFEEATFTKMSPDNPHLYPKDHLAALADKIEQDALKNGNSDRP